MPSTNYSQHGEDSFMAQHMPMDASRVVVDVGANDGVSWSNSRMFGLRGWRLLLIEPMPEYAERCRRLYDRNPQVSVEELAIATEHGMVEFHINLDAATDQLAMRSSLLRHMVPSEQIRSVTVVCEPLQSVLLRHAIPLDFAVLNVDAEGMDLAVLRSLDLEMFRPRFICVEEGEAAEEIELHLTRFRYRRALTLGPNGIYVMEGLDRLAEVPANAAEHADGGTGSAVAPPAFVPIHDSGFAVAKTAMAGRVGQADASAADMVTLLAAVADELHVLAHSLGSIGHRAIGLHLHEAASAFDRALPAQEGWWSSAFNGQEGRRRLFLRLLEMFRPVAVVETGTFRGTTTAFIASHFAGRVLTCEIDPRWYLTAQANLAPYPNVEVRQTDSRAFLRALLAESPADTLIYYLDAHWQGDLPLREEIELILSHGQPAAIMIDDFAVPSDADYRYDDYGPGKTLSIELLAGIAPRGAVLFFPTLPASEETGARRGCAVIGVGNAATVLAGLAELQPHDWPAAAEEVPKPTLDPAPDQALALAPLWRLVTARDVEAEQDALRARAKAAEEKAERYRAEIIEVGARAETAAAELERFRDVAKAAEEKAERYRAEIIEVGARPETAAAELERFRDEAKAAEEKAERFRGEAEALQASTSWRITRPLRRIRRLLG